MRFSLEEPPSLPGLLRGEYEAPPQEEMEEELRGSATRWFYGPGIGRTMANVGTVVAFPPYALLLLGNAGLTLAGAEPLTFAEALPERPRKEWLGLYDSVTGLPGRINALVAGREFHRADDDDERD